MSRSDRETRISAATTTPFPDVPYLWTVRFGSPPEGLGAGMRTIDPAPMVGANRPEESESAYVIESAAAIIQQMEAACGEAISSQDLRARLAFLETRNCITGEPGIVVRRLVEPPLRYSDPLAELLVPAGQFEKAKNWLQDFSRGLSKGRVRIVVFRRRGEVAARPSAFAAVVSDQDPTDVRLYARLLLTPIEISQWWDPGIETQRETVN